MRALSSEQTSWSQAQAPALSIVTLTLNELDRLTATTASIDSQQGCTIEHLVVNGGSPVPLPDPVNPLVTRRVISAPPLGIYDAMNRGLAAATGRGIMFLHSGDGLFRPDSAMVAYSLLRESDWGYGGLVVIRQGRARTRRHIPYFRVAIGLGLTYTPHPSTIMATPLLRALGGFDPMFGVAADQMTLLRAGQVARPSRTRRLLAVHHEDGESADRDPDVLASEYGLIRQNLPSPLLGSRTLDEVVAGVGTVTRKVRRSLRAVGEASHSAGAPGG